MTKSEQFEIEKENPNAPDAEESRNKAPQKGKTPKEKLGTIVRIAGPVLDVRFLEGAEPPIQTLLVTVGELSVHMEVVQHYAPGIVRTIALEPTEGLYCGIDVFNTSGGIRVPVGENVLGRVIDCLGRPHRRLG